ncbi:hypothetical protein WICPIJ_009328 [Wickerhamomyces pijperi]|uniref:Phosducin domain-containing protein n=1 Tax=Wickerhamomyces pijperi TaxID=599730 RepID=A0A9P8PNQ0_WICPI|nr:hypothetical protein WICPIJ_009328 [Wickerhamomyces pijperi]
MDPNAKIQVQVDETEDTEWNDILRAKGIIPERPPSPSAQIEQALEEAIVKQWENRLENKTIEELEDLEDEEDEEFLESYKLKRMQEINTLNKKRERFGVVYPVTKPEYNKEITEASKQSSNPDADEDDGTFVFVHMSSQSALQSRLLSSLFQTLARKFEELKFVDIPAIRAVENYPDSNTPTLLIYHKGDVVKQYVTLLQLGGNSTTLKDMEAVLVKVGAVASTDRRLIINSDEDELENSGSLKFMKKSIRGRADDSDDDDFFD